MVDMEDKDLKEKLLVGDYKRLMVFKSKAISLKSAMALEKNIEKINKQIAEAKRKEEKWQETVDKLQFYQIELEEVKKQMTRRYEVMIGITDEETETPEKTEKPEKDEEDSPEEVEEPTDADIDILDDLVDEDEGEK